MSEEVKRMVSSSPLVEPDVDALRSAYEASPQIRQEPDGTWTLAGTPYCGPGEHDWRPEPAPHASVTGRLFTCSKCKHQTTVGP